MKLLAVVVVHSCSYGDKSLGTDFGPAPILAQILAQILRELIDFVEFCPSRIHIMHVVEHGAGSGAPWR